MLFCVVSCRHIFVQTNTVLFLNSLLHILDLVSFGVLNIHSTSSKYTWYMHIRGIYCEYGSCLLVMLLILIYLLFCLCLPEVLTHKASNVYLEYYVERRHNEILWCERSVQNLWKVIHDMYIYGLTCCSGFSKPITPHATVHSGLTNQKKSQKKNEENVYVRDIICECACGYYGRRVIFLLGRNVPFAQWITTIRHENWSSALCFQ